MEYEKDGAEKHSKTQVSGLRDRGLDNQTLCDTKYLMQTPSASDHLQVIRTLMERSALYRRALAPITIFVGSLGVIAALAGWAFKITQPVAFVGYWYVVGATAISGAFLMVRRQALKDAEPFWSPPTRRVARAMLPPLTAGFVLGVLLTASELQHSAGPDPTTGLTPQWIYLICLPLSWVILYGCAVHASGFFMTRGMQLFGWLIIAGGCATFLVGAPPQSQMPLAGYGIMGGFFGVLHIAYGVYLYFTEKRGSVT